MLVLSLDSSSIASVALARDGDVLAEFATRDTRSHAEALAPAVRDLMAQAGVAGSSLDGILVGTGPGPFTGLRAGLVTARTLGFAWGVPVFGLCSLDALAHRAAQHAEEDGDVAVAIDARRRELYWGRYTVRQDARGRWAQAVDGPQVGVPDRLPDLPLYGHGAGLYPDPNGRTVAESVEWQPTAADLARAAWALEQRGVALATDTSPLYLRESDAQVPPARKKALA